MDSNSKNQLVSLPLIVAMIANPVLAERLPAAAQEPRTPRVMSNQQRLAVGLAPQTMASAIVIDESVNREQRPGLKESSNGTVVVDIAAATAAGVSHNRYSEFNVTENGLILNNSQAPVLTQLGGWTDGNRRLAGGEARIILNEVTGSNRSGLMGHIEVAGQAAEFVLANQNGITCDGCGFINIPKATLVTGRAKMINGDIDGFTLGDGNIVLQGDGINASNVDRFDIVTRMASINASLYGKNVNVFTGNDYFSYRDGVISSTENSQSSPYSGVALDIAALGGMYAHSIHLIGTEKGLGVNSEGLIQSVEQLEISADGDIRIKNAVANEALTIASASESIVSDGQVYAPAVDLRASETITNTGVLAARDSLALQAERIIQQGDLYAGMAEDGSLLSEASFSLREVNHLENSGFLYSAESLSLSLQSVSNDNGQMVSGGGIELEAIGRISNRAGVLQAQSGSVHLTADALDNHAGEIYAADQFELLIEAGSGVDNSQGTLFGAEATSIQVAGGDIENFEGRIKSQHIELDADKITNESGFIDAQSLNVNAGTFENHRGVLLANDSDGEGISLRVRGGIDNEEGSIHSAGESLRVSSVGLNNSGGTISSAKGRLLVSVLNDVDNTLGTITGQTLTLDAADLTNTDGLVSADALTGRFDGVDNHGGTIQAQRLRIEANQYQSAGGLLLAHGEQAELNLNIDGLINNTAGASIQAQGENLGIVAERLVNRDSDILHYGNGVLNLAAINIDNIDGIVSSQGDVRIDVSTLDNRGGVINGNGLYLTGRELINDDGRLSASNITLDSRRISNRSGLLSASNRLNLKTFALDNVGGEIAGTNGVTLSFEASDALDNREGAIFSGRDLRLDAEGAVDNAGVLQSQDSFKLEADQFANYGQLLAGSLSLVSNDLSNHGGGLIEAQSLRVDATDLQNAGAIISSGESGQNFQLRVGSFFNSGLLEVYSHNLQLSDIAYVADSGSIIHHGEGQLFVATGEVFDNRTGVLYTAGNLDINALVIDNRGGEISAGKTLGLTVDEFNNEEGLLQSGGSVAFELSELNNRAGRIHLFSDDDSSFTIENTLDVTDGEIISFGEGGLLLTANQVANTRGEISSNSDIDIQTETYLNQQGVLSSALGVKLTASEIDNLEGEISGQSVTVTAPTFENHGVVSAFSQQGEALTLYVDELINRGIVESYGVTLDLSNARLDNREGRLLHKGEGALTLTQQTLDNTLGQLYTAGSLSVSVESVDNTSGEIVAQGAANVNATQGIINHAGVIQTHGNLTVQADELRNEAEGYVIALGEKANFNVAHLTNDAVIQVAHDVSINANEISNSGDLTGTGVSLSANQLHNTGFISAQNLTAQAEQLLNTQEGIVQAGELSMVADDLINAGTLVGYGQDDSGVSLSADTLANTGRIESHGDTLSVQARVLTNLQGLLVASGEESHLAVATETFDNRDGVLASSDTLAIGTDSFVNTGGEVGAEQTLLLQAGQLDNTGGVISSGAELDITATLLNNTDDGLLVADERISANATNFDNTGGRLATSELNLTLDALLNLNGLISADHFSIATDSVDNTQGLLVATDSLIGSTLSATGFLNNTGGILQVDGGSFTITTGELTNVETGQVVHSGAGRLAVTAGRIENGAESIIAGESKVYLTAHTDIINQGAIQAAGNVVLDAAKLENNMGRILADGGISIHADSVANRSANEQERGWLNADWIDITAARFTNDEFARVEATELLVSASEIVNQGLLLATEEQATSRLVITADTISNSGHIESYNGAATVQSGVIDNSGVIAQTQGQTLQLEVDTLHNSGSLVGDGELAVIAKSQLLNQGQIAGTGSGAVSLSAAVLDNEQGLLSASNLHIQAGQLNNLAGEINADTLDITSQTLINDTATILASNLSIEASEVINQADAGEQSYISADTLAISADFLSNNSTVQGEQLTLDADTLTNRQGKILATGLLGESLCLLSEQVDNSGGFIESHGEHLSVGAVLTNQQGTLLHAGDGVLTLSDIDNSAGQVATEGSLLLEASEVNNSQDGLIQVAGGARVSAINFDNQDGTLVTGQGLSLSVDELQNTDGGLVLSQSTKADDFLWSGNTWNNQGGTLEVHSVDQILQLDGFDNSDGNLYHAATGKLTLETLADWDTGDGLIVSDGDIQVEAQQRFTNSGALAADGIEIHATNLENQLDSVINAVWMSLDAQYATNFGTIQTGQLSLASGVLRNEATATGDDSYTGGLLMITSEEDNAFRLNGNGLENTAGARLQLHSASNQIDGEVINQGVLAALGDGELSFNGLVNHQGVVYSGGSITVDQADWDNRQGEMRADGAVNAVVEILNNTQGVVQATAGLNISADSVANVDGSVFSENGIALSLQQALDNTRGAVVAESGEVTIQADRLLNERGFIEQAGYGDLTLELDSLLNNTGGQINTQSHLLIDAAQIINNAFVQLGDDDREAIINAAHMTLTAEQLSNAGGYVQGQEALLLDINHIDNRAGTLIANGESNGSFVLQSELLDNRNGGSLQVFQHDVSLVGVELDNRSGIIEHRGEGLFAANSASVLRNVSGVIQSAGDITLNAASIDNTDGAIAGRGVTLTADNTIHNTDKGYITGDTLNLSAQWVDNTNQGIVASVGEGEDTLTLNVGDFSNHYGTVRNSSTNWDFVFGEIDNENGTIIHTGSGLFNLDHLDTLTLTGTVASTGDIRVSASDLHSTGNLLADGDMTLDITGALVNSGQAIIRAGQALNATVGGQIDNSGGITAFSGFDLTATGALANSGIIVTDSEDATITASRLTNRGDIAHNGTGTFSLNTAELENGLVPGAIGVQEERTAEPAGTLKTGGILAASGVALNNNGVISASTLQWTDFDTLVNQSLGRIEAGSIQLRGNSVDNAGQLVATGTSGSLELAVATLTNRDGATLASNSQNQSFIGDVINAGSIVHAGTGVLKLGNAGVMDISGGTVSTAGIAQLSGSITGAGTVSAAERISITGVGTFTNTGSTLYSEGDIDISAAVNNQQGVLIADGVLDIDTNGTIENNNGHLQGGRVQLNASRLNNTGGGKILSTNGGSGYISVGSLNNRGGSISANNASFSVSTSGTLDNTDGSIQQTGGTLTVTAQYGLNNTSGKVQSAGTLRLRGGDIENNNEGILSGSVLDINTSALTNTSLARIIGTGSGASEINVSDLTNSATISAGGSGLNLDVASMFNNTGGTLALTGTGLLGLTFNEYQSDADSKIRSNANLSLQTTQAFSNAGEISAGGFLSIYAQSFSNASSGVVDSGNILAIDTIGGNFSNAGTVSSGVTLEVETSDFSNSGTLASDNAIRLNMNSLTLGGGEIAAQGLLDIEVVESVVIGNGDVLETEGNLYLKTQNDFINNGTISAGGAVWLEGGNLANSDTAKINAGQAIDNQLMPNAVDLPDSSYLNFSQSIVNGGVLSSSAGLVLNSSSVSNTGNFISGGRLAVFADDLSNSSSGVIFSNEDMYLGVSDSLTNEGADIVAFTNMVIDGRSYSEYSNGGWAATGFSSTQAIQNIGARIESFGNMYLTASSITNRRDGISLIEGERTIEDTLLRSGGGGTYLAGEGEATVIDGPTPSPTRENKNNERYSAKKIERTTTQYYEVENQGSRDAIISSGGDLRVEDGVFVNDHGTINIGNNLFWYGDDYVSISSGDYAEQEVKEVDEFEWYHEGCGNNGGQFCTFAIIEYEGQTTLIDGEEIFGTISIGGGLYGEADDDFTLQTQRYSGGSDTKKDVGFGVFGTERTGLANATRESATVSGDEGEDGETIAETTLENKYSGYRSGSDAQADAGGEETIGINIISRQAEDSTVKQVQAQQVAVSTARPTEERAEAGDDFVQNQLQDLIARYTPKPEVSAAEQAQGGDAGVDGTGAQQQALADGESSPVAGTQVDGNSEVVASNTNTEGGNQTLPAENTDQLAEFKSRAAEQGKEVVLTPGGQYVMVESKNPDASGAQSPTGIEISTAPDNYNPDNLGGLYVENTAPEGQYLVETRPEYTEYGNFLGSDYLLDAIGYNPDKTHKRLGDAFYENQIIRDALMDQATTRYLGQNTSDYDQMKRLMDNAIAANRSMELAAGVALTPEQAASLTQDIVWMVEEEVNGETVLVPRLYLASMSESDLLSTDSALRVGGDINLSVGGDAIFGADISSRGNMIFHAGGDVQQNADLDSTQGVWLDASGELVNNGSANADMLELTAGGSVKNLGSLVSDRGLWINAGDSVLNQSVGEMVSGGVLSVHAKNDIINAQGYIEGRDVSLTAERGDIINRTEFEQITGNTRSGGSYISTTVGEDSIIVSHNSLMMDAGNNIDLQGSSFAADGTISLNAGNDVLLGAVEDKTAHQFDLGSFSGSRERTTYRVVNIDAGEHLLINAGRDIVGEGSQLSAGGSAMLNAERDIHLSAVANVDHSAFDRKDYERSGTIITHTQATVNADGDASLHAGQDINLTGANIIADRNISLHAERDTNILAVTDSEHHYLYERDDKSFGRSETTEVETLSSTNVGSVIQAGGNITVNTLLDEGGDVHLQNSRNVTIQGSLLDAGSDIAVSALENVTMTTGQETYLDYSHRSSSGLGGLTRRSQSDTAADVVQVGSMLNSGNDVVVMAGNDVGIAGSVVSPNNDVELYAGLINDEGDINIESVSHERFRASESSRTSVSLDVGSDSVSVSEEKTVKQDNTSTANAASYILAGGEIYGDASRDINVTGSVLSANGTVQLDAGRHVTIQSGASERSAGDEDKKRRYGASWDTTSNDVSAFVGSETNAIRHQQDYEGVVGSYIGGQQINVNSGEDINVIGSDLDAGGSLILDAGNDVNILSSEEALTTSTRTSFTQDGLTMAFSHNVGQAVDAIGDLGSGGDAASDASGVMKAMDAMDSVAPSASIFLGQTTTSQTESDTSTFARGSNLNAGDDVVIRAGNNATVSGSQVNADRNIQVDANDITISSAENTTQLNSIHNYDQVGLTLAGGQGNVSLTAGFATSESDYRQEMFTTVGSSLNAGQDINLNARNDFTTEGSDINAERNIDLRAGNNVAIIAGEGYVRSTLDEEHLSGGGGVNLGSDGFGYTAYVAAGENDLDRQNITNRNSTVSAGEGLTITSGADADISGANLTAADVNMDIGGDLTVASVQDTGSVSGRRWDASLSVTVGAGVSASASVGYGETEGSSAWVSNQTSITGSSSVNINVGGHTQVDGALIANIQEDGTDGGNLNLSTETFGYTNLEDHHEETSSYLSVGFGNDAATGDTGWSVSGNYSDVDQQQTTYATLGNGAITVRGDSETGADSTAGINRDTDEAQEITRDKEIDLEVYVTSNSIESFSGLFTADNPDTPEIENTFSRWQSNIENLGRNTVLVYEGIDDFTEHEDVPQFARNIAGAMVDMADTAGYLTLGIAPSVKNHGGLAGQAGTLVVGDQFFYHVTAQTSYNPETMNVDLEGYEVVEVDKPLEGYTVSTNGMNNTLDDSIRNGVMQTGSDKFIQAYNPQHGFLGDVLESFWDKNIGGVVSTGNARQLNDFYQTGIDHNTSFNIAAHSQGTLINQRAIEGLDFTNGGTIQPGSVQFSGSPIGFDAFIEVTTQAGFPTYVENQSRGLEPNLIFQTNRPEGETSLFGFPLVDSVSDAPVFLGGNFNQGQGGSLGGSIFSLPELFADHSPHSNYICQTPACTESSESIPSAVQTFRDNLRTPDTGGGGYIRPEIIYPPRPALDEPANQFQLSQTPVITNELSGAALTPNSYPELERSPLVQQPYQYPEHNVESEHRPSSQSIDLTLHLVPKGDGQTSDQERERRQITLPEIVNEAVKNHGEIAGE
ncbi:hemagglutinin repeat-containing protein [uncultured Gilvimarinus sp.]|uniref:hemagglutinin repeat-containing protein n=1 Tax=uncultured Gilvimarinus sp. TaxID=1689143 RepID=UPI0030EC7187